ncbi:MAG TPA: hypothetical protein VFC47_12405 [Caulobacteraceae bacterium]|nr:hypothetical protein [Caulobacteraceae bacterium]
MKPNPWIWALSPALACLVSCATPGSSVEVGSQATGSSYFTLSRPAVYKARVGLELAGRACRRARTTLLSPSRVRLEHVAANGEVAESARAYLPPLSRRADQACASYAARVTWRLGDGETVRACFDRGRPCPADSGPKAIVPVPATVPPG